MDEQWTTTDKLEQLRGVTSLYKNTNANIKEKILSQRKKQNKEIKNLTAQNKKFRQQYEEVLKGNKTNLLPALTTHPTMQLAFKNLNPQEIEEELKQSIFCKNKELDRLRFKRQNLEKIFLNKKLKSAGLQKEVDEQPENYLWEQEIANQIQSISVRQNAAHANRVVFEKALNILQKDAIRFDEVLDGLRKDLVHQCESIVKAVEMGQKVSEELNSLQKEYKKTEKAVRANMRQRDRAIRGLRAEIDSIRQHVHPGTRESRSGLQGSPVRQSNPNLDDTDDNTNIQALLDTHIHKEIGIYEGILNKIKEAAQVHRLQDICPRLEEQKRQRGRLQKQVMQNEEELSRMLELHSQLEVMLEVVMYHTMTDEAKKLKEERVQLTNDIGTEKDNLNEIQTELVKIGKKIVDVRTALLTLNMMLDTVFPGTESSKTDMVIEVESDNAVDPMGMLRPLYQPNTEALTLMEQVTRKVKWLIDQVGTQELDTKPTITTKFVAISTTKIGLDDEADNIVSDMLDELEDMDDPSVLTRKDIKAESQRLVELYDNPRAMFQDSNQPKYKKHKCF